MRWRRDEWSERVSALVLLAGSMFVAEWSRDRIAASEAALTCREQQLERFAAWSRGDETATAPCPDLGAGEWFAPSEVVAAAPIVVPSSRPVAGVSR